MFGEIHLDIRAITDLARLKASSIVGLTVILGIVLVTKQIILDKVILGFAVGFILSASTNTINDIMDLEIDRYEKPNRPLPRGDITINQTWYIFFVETVIALICGLLLSLQSFLLAAFVAFISLLYSFRLKDSLLFKNTLTAFGIASAFLVGVLATDQFPIPTFLFFLQIFVTVVAFEIHKDIADIMGDKKLGKVTIATKYGSKNAAYLAFTFYVGAFTIFQLILLNSTSSFLPILLIVDLVGTSLGFSFLIPILRNQDSNTIHSSRKKIMALLGLFVLATILNFLG